MGHVSSVAQMTQLVSPSCPEVVTQMAVAGWFVVQMLATVKPYVLTRLFSMFVILCDGT